MCTGAKTTSSQPDYAAMNSGTLQLKRNVKSIALKYDLYVSHILKALKRKGTNAEDLCSDLLTIPATSLAEQDLTLLSAHIKAELMKANELDDIFHLLVTKYTSSFFNYEIFQYIVEKYEIDHGEEVLQYPEHLKAYIMKHKVPECFEYVNNVSRMTHDPDATFIELLLKFDTSEISNIMDLKTSIAEILGINPMALQLHDCEQGDSVIVFLIPTPVANLLFNKHTLLTELQKEQFRAWSVRWIRCNDYMVPIAKVINDGQKQEICELRSHGCSKYFMYKFYLQKNWEIQ